MANAAGWLVVIFLLGPTVRGVAGAVMYSLFLLIARVDLESRLIPNMLVAAVLLAGVMYHFLTRDLSITSRLAGMGAGFLALFSVCLLSRGGVGGGDVKLLSAIGFWLGCPGVLYALFIAAVGGSLAGLILMAAGKKKKADTIAFGPFLALGFIIVFLTGTYTG
ncbi:MAG: A24 family peptidase [Peptococcaceae bacterium]|nr:A24 family peptidase [Peptococcaceae bacterium]MDH7525364.1 A24 family peptidase [Peptococcaceae bacterium]